MNGWTRFIILNVSAFAVAFFLPEARHAVPHFPSIGIVSLSLLSTWAWGPLLWPGIACGIVANEVLQLHSSEGIQNVGAGLTFGIILLHVLIPLLQGYLGTMLLGWPRSGKLPLFHIKGTLRFLFLVAGFVSFIGAALNALILFLLMPESLPTHLSLNATLDFAGESWAVEAASIAITIPFIFVWFVKKWPRLTRRETGEAIGLTIVAGLVLTAFFTYTPEVTGSYDARTQIDVEFAFRLGYITFPLFGWAALRFGMRGATLCTLVAAVVSDLATMQQLGPFAITPHPGSVVSLHLYQSALAITTLLIAAAMTERRDATRALRISEDRHRSLVESLTDWIWETDVTGVITYCSPSITDILGYRPEDVVNRTPFGAISEEDRAQLRTVMQGLAAGGIVRGLEVCALAKDGRRVFVEISGTPAFDEDGVLTGYRGVCRDITPRKRDEAIHKLNEERLETLLRLNQMEHEPLEEITRFTLDAATRLTQSEVGYLAFANEDETILSMHAWTRTAMDQCAVQDKPLDYPVESTGLWGEVVRQRKPIIVNDYSAPNPMKRGYPEGHVALTRVMNVPIFENERIVIVAGVGNKATNYTDSDLTQITLLMAGMWRLIQRRREEEAERERQEQFAQADKLITLGMLVSGVAHEINNPNNFIMLNAPIVKTAWYGFKPILDRFYEREGDFSAGGFPYSQLRDILGNLLDDIREGAVRIKHIVAELKDYARPASHDADQPVAVNEVIRGAVTLLTNHIRKRTRRFHVEYGRDLPQVRGNFQKVEQMLINLIENACDSLEHEDQAVYVRSGYDEPCERVYIEVEDQGCGIPPENLKRIMDPFFTTKRDIGGMGLGLSIVDRIVKDHAAEIRFSPAPGRGTLVQVFMRLAPRPHESPYRENQEKP